MIRMRALASALLAVAVVGASLTDSVGPGRTLAAERLVAERAAVALDLLDRLERALEPVIDDGRRGAAHTVTGDTSPAAAFTEAADQARAAEPIAAEVVRAVVALDAARLARDPDLEPIGSPVASGELASIAGQLSATAEAAHAFVSRRRAAESAASHLEDALAAFEGGDLAAAAEATDAARRAHAVVAAWEAPLEALPVWVSTTGAMIGAMDRIVDAVRRGDADAARLAADEFMALGDEAAPAARALRIAISEGGNAVAAPALTRLARVLADVEAARDRVAAVVDGTRR